MLQQYSVELDHSMSIFKEYIISIVYLYIYLLWDVKVNACVEPRLKVHGTPRVWEVNKSMQPGLKHHGTQYVELLFSVAMHSSIPKQLQIPIWMRAHSCPE